MSRIDKALQAWEKSGGVGVVRPEPVAYDVHASSPFGLNGYAREDGAASFSQRSTTNGSVPPPANEPLNLGARFAVKPQVTSDMEARLVSAGSGAVPVEQYRRLAATLHDVQVQQGLRTLMLTSSLPGEGKTLTSVNLALTLSGSYDRRVLVIDADLRWPSLHKMFGVSNDVGLSEALQSNRVDLPLKQVSPRLSLLTAGRPDVTPLAALTSARMASLIEQCANEFDWVLFDTPPVGLLPDAQLLTRLTRAVVLVIAAGTTPEAAVARAVAEIGRDSIVGTVLNRVSEREIPQAGYYSRYYQSRSDSE